MKKYFLLTVLFAYLFLWLGSFSLGQYSVCPDSSMQFYQDCVDCIDNGLTWNNDECINDWISGTDTTDTTTSECTNDTTLSSRVNAENSSTGIWCVCKDWYKRVDNECKSCSDPGVCCGVSLNTSIPFIGKCIESQTNYKSPDETSVTWETAFPVLMWSLTKILVTAILIVSFVLIVVWGIMISTGNPSGWKKLIIKVVVGIALLGASWVILRLINPNFFG